MAGNDPEEWKRIYTADDNKQLYLNPSYIFGAMREAARYTKNGVTSIQSKVSATLQVITNRIYLNRYMPEQITQNEDDLVYLDVSGVRNPSTKARNVRYRVALSPGWETEFRIIWENTIWESNRSSITRRRNASWTGGCALNWIWTF
ncbi:hypothetical protein [Oceanobacillus profundus]|uniref:hypothetical protein n=1 Tax=Oceanobacillus profundus TaxID=372463 RepID=UPI00363B2DE2